MPETPLSLAIKERILSGDRFSTVLISSKLSIPEVITGYILTKTGVIVERPDHPKLGPDVAARIDRRLAIGLKTSGIPLYDQSIQNPQFLQNLILESDLDNYTQIRLRRLVLHSEFYRRYRPSEWWRVGLDLQDGRVANLSFHRYLAERLLIMADNPRYAYDDCIRWLDRLLPKDRGDLAIFKQEYAAEVLLRAIYGEQLKPPNPLDIENFTITSTTPIFKNLVGEPDQIEYKQFEFNLGNLALLKQAHLGLVVGGSPNSGKSTLSASLYEAMKDLIHLGIASRVVEASEVNVGICDLDSAAPTIKFITRGRIPSKQRGTPWGISSLLQTHRDFSITIGRCNVTIGDLPGGKPDDITELLVHPAQFSIVIDKDYQESMKMWQDYFLGVNYPTPLVGIHSRFHDPEREMSGIRSYESVVAKRSAKNFLSGRVVDFDRVVQQDNPFVDFAAKVLLLDFLPQHILAKNEYKRNLGRSLGLIN